MSPWLVFIAGCTVFFAIFTAAFLLGIAQFMRWEQDDDELAPVHVLHEEPGEEVQR